MRIPAEHTKILVNEIDIVRKKIREAPDPKKKIYYFSGLYAMTNRLLNLHYDPDLLFLDYILNSSYLTINNSVEASRTGVYSWELQADFFTRLDTYLKELQSRLGDNKDITDSLKKLVALAYSVTGNGNYLLQKGIDLLPS